MLQPLRLRDFRLLWTGMAVSLLGDGVFFVAMAWQVYELSNAPTALGMVGLAMSIPHVLLLLLGGVLSDRFDRRRVLMSADAVRGLALLTLGILSVTGAIELWHMMLLVALYGGGTAFFGPAFDAIVPDLVPPDQLGQANSIDQFVRPVAWRLAGPALGGWLIAAWGLGGAFFVDAISFAVSITAVLLMSPHPVSTAKTSEEADEGRSAFRELTTGFRFVRANAWLWGTLVAATFAYLLFIGPSEVLLPFLVKNDLGGDVRVLGYILAMGGIGAIGAAVIVGRRDSPRRYVTVMYVAWTISTLAVAGYGLARFPWQAMAACFLFNAFETVGAIIWATTKHRLVPRHMLGRISSFDWFISIGLLPVSYALTGPVAALVGARPTLVGAGLLGGVVTFAFLFLPGMRAIERTHPVAEQPPEPEDIGFVRPGSLLPSAPARLP